MLLTLTASSASDFILIGAGLVWQTLPARWVENFESHFLDAFLDAGVKRMQEIDPDAGSNI